MTAIIESFTGFAHTPAGVIMCIAAVAVVVGCVYDCILQRRIDKSEDETAKYVKRRVSTLHEAVKRLEESES